jgi:hypothetical protein
VNIGQVFAGIVVESEDECCPEGMGLWMRINLRNKNLSHWDHVLDEALSEFYWVTVLEPRFTLADGSEVRLEGRLFLKEGRWRLTLNGRTMTLLISGL